jgi:hypothetical protein
MLQLASVSLVNYYLQKLALLSQLCAPQTFVLTVGLEIQSTVAVRKNPLYARWTCAQTVGLEIQSTVAVRKGPLCARWTCAQTESREIQLIVVVSKMVIATTL